MFWWYPFSPILASVGLVLGLFCAGPRGEGGPRGENFALAGTALCAISLSITVDANQVLRYLQWDSLFRLTTAAGLRRRSGACGVPPVTSRGGSRNAPDLPEGPEPDRPDHRPRAPAPGRRRPGSGWRRSTARATPPGRTRSPPQPVPFSHTHHVGQLGIDCRYCHTSVETSRLRRHPADQDVHELPPADVGRGRPARAGPRAATSTNTPIAWNRVHNLPHYAYFNHSIHVAKGVGCVVVPRPVDQMNLTFQTKTLLMEWCLDCHRDPEKHLRPKEEVFSMTWTPDGGGSTVGTNYPDGRRPRPMNRRPDRPTSGELGRAEGAVQGPRRGHADELLDVPPVSQRRSVKSAQTDVAARCRTATPDP